MFMSLSTVLNNNKNLKNGGAYWNRGAYLQKHVLWGALIRKGALIGRRALNRIITVHASVISLGQNTPTRIDLPYDTINCLACLDTVFLSAILKS